MSYGFADQLASAAQAVVDEENAQLQVATDAVLQTGWRPDRLRIYNVAGDPEPKRQLVILAGFGLPRDLVVFEVARELREASIVVIARWRTAIPRYEPAQRGHAHESLRWLEYGVARPLLRSSRLGELNWGEWVQQRVPECCRDAIERIVADVFEDVRHRPARPSHLDAFVSEVLRRARDHVLGE